MEEYVETLKKAIRVLRGLDIVEQRYCSGLVGATEGLIHTAEMLAEGYRSEHVTVQIKKQTFEELSEFTSKIGVPPNMFIENLIEEINEKSVGVLCRE